MEDDEFQPYKPRHRKTLVPLTIHVSEGQAVLNITGSPMGISVRRGDTVTIRNPGNWTVTHGA